MSMMAAATGESAASPAQALAPVQRDLKLIDDKEHTCFAERVGPIIAPQIQSILVGDMSAQLVAAGYVDETMEHEYYQMAFAKAMESITGYRSCCCSIWRWPYFLPNAKTMAESIFDEFTKELGIRNGQKALSLTIEGEPVPEV